MSRSRRPSGPSPARAIHQMLPRLAWGDAVGNQVRYLQALFRGWGYTSEVYADQWDEECRAQVRPAEDWPKEADEDSVLLIHHSFESRQVPRIARGPGRKVLVYHNVTPAPLFEGFDRKVAAACQAAREELLALRPHVEAAFAYSHFSAEELTAAGFPRVAVLPFALDWKAFHAPPDPTFQAEFDDGCVNILFVGRAVPSKRIDDVMRVFAAYQRLYQPRSRLLIAGYLNRETPYGTYLHGVKELLGAERIHLLGRVSASQLSACYAVATAYLSMSRHEGFGVPLLEAMEREVPVVAYGAAAVPETMGGAGLATRTREPEAVAQLLAVLEREPSLRKKVLAGQRTRLESLGQEAVAERVREALRPLLEGTPVPYPVANDATGLNLVCPGYLSHPHAPMSLLARKVAEQLPQARVLTLSPNTPLLSKGPRVVSEGDTSVWHFSPDQPLPLDAAEAWPLPGSSSLEMAVRHSTAPTVFLGAGTEVARHALPHVREHAWAVHEASAPAEARELGARLIPLETGAVEEASRRLVAALRRSGETHARG
ncbi:glycosyltransferase family 4 protein [Hyalangium rubrum]|uniref:Glycosyltransferase n=1 Tax=Hyalangium rubrum TaxID=3103134 RepID=A0ABU5H8A5_9BACT|nr:glycosyltransferase [Hyalangium sp. s54d21]MDY7229545.1 glycosyltransferase [Hyalangium sp. s54d21]